MRIGIDVSYAVNEGTGVGRYSFELVKAILKLDHANDYWLYANFFFDRRRKRRKLRELVGEAKNVHLVITHLPGQLKDWLFWALPVLVRHWLPNLDVFHALTFQAAAPLGQKLVLTIHDLSYFEKPSWYGSETGFYQNQTKRAYRLADLVIVPSKTTAMAVERFLGKRKRLRLIPEGVARHFFVKKRKYQIQNHKSQIILAVGRGARKNIDEVAQLLPLTVLSHADDRQLVAAYRKATVLVYPSLSEGFGLPVLEAMAASVPVVTAKRSAMAEFAKGAALLVDPTNPNEIVAALKQVLENPLLAHRMTRAGRRIAKQYTWAKAAHETIRVYQGP